MTHPDLAASNMPRSRVDLDAYAPAKQLDAARNQLQPLTDIRRNFEIDREPHGGFGLVGIAGEYAAEGG